MKIIGISGQAGSGKDTLAKYILVKANGFKGAFADPMKALTRKVFRFTDEQQWGPTEMRNAVDERYKAFDAMRFNNVLSSYCNVRDQWLASISHGTPEGRAALDAWLWGCLTHLPLTPRFALQTLGTEFGRTMEEGLWIRVMAERAKALATTEPNGIIVITDLRFINEAKWLREQGSCVVRIVRPYVTGEAANLAGVANHKSEQEQKGYDMVALMTHTINNDGTLEDLEKKAEAFLTDVGIPWSNTNAAAKVADAGNAPAAAPVEAAKQQP